MNLAQYKTEALAFCNRLEGYQLNLAHAGLGLGTEGIELLEGVVEAMMHAETMTLEQNEQYDRNFIEELGDMTWFAALLADVKGIDFGQFDITPWPTTVIDLEVFINITKLIAVAGTLADYTKKEIVYGKQIDAYAYIDELREFFMRMRIVVRSVEIDLTVEKVLDANIAKLAARFPDKVYSQSAALNRDKPAEMAAIGAATA